VNSSAITRKNIRYIQSYLMYLSQCRPTSDICDQPYQRRYKILCLTVLSCIKTCHLKRKTPFKYCKKHECRNFRKKKVEQGTCKSPTGYGTGVYWPP